MRELQGFIETYWRRGHVLASDAALLRWQHVHSQDADLLSVLIAEKGERMLGILGVIPVGFCIRGCRAAGAWLTTWIASPEGRALQVGLRLLQRALTEGYEVVGTLGQNETARRIFAALGFDVWENIPRWLRIVSLSALEYLLAGRAEPYSPESWTAWRATAARAASPPSPAARVVDWSEGLAERWDQAWQERFAPRLLGTWRDAEYLRWRYVAHPRFRYVLRCAEDAANGDLLGLTVYRMETVRGQESRVLRVAEFLSEAEAGDLLARTVLKAAEEVGAAFADCYCTSEAFVAPLGAAGFVHEDAFPDPLPNLFQPLEFDRQRLAGAFWVKPEVAGDRSAFFRARDFYLTRADGDQDRPN